MKRNLIFIGLLCICLSNIPLSAFKSCDLLNASYIPQCMDDQEPCLEYIYDTNNIRYTLASSNKDKALNWIFLPGGPGVDSRYFQTLIELLHLPGDCWLVDFPGNGSHEVTDINYDTWFTLLIPMIQRFENPIIVGHSFGGMFPLLFPELEKLLAGYVILNSSPTLWLEAAAEFAKNHNLPDLTAEITEFTLNPTQETSKKLLQVCVPYYFSPDHLEVGSHFILEMIFNYNAANWWLKKAHEINFNAQWIPQNVPTLLITGECDGMVPSILIEKDTRFNRGNIKKELILDAGHFPWIEKPEEVKRLFHEFQMRL